MKAFILFMLFGTVCYGASYKETAQFIKSKEALRLKPYRCPAGKVTIGWGHVIKQNEKWMMRGITTQQAQAIFTADMQRAYNIVAKYNIKDKDTALALTSFVFNCGEISKVLQDKNLSQFKNYVYANGVKLRGLVNRRAGEVKLMQSNYYPTATPQKANTTNQQATTVSNSAKTTAETPAKKSKPQYNTAQAMNTITISTTIALLLIIYARKRNERTYTRTTNSPRLGGLESYRLY